MYHQIFESDCLLQSLMTCSESEEFEINRQEHVATKLLEQSDESSALRMTLMGQSPSLGKKTFFKQKTEIELYSYTRTFEANLSL